MDVRENYDLTKINTFKVQAKASEYVLLSAEEELAELKELLDARGEAPTLILGGGSNVLFRRDFEGLVVHNRLHGISFLPDDETHRYVRVAAGEVWHSVVRKLLDAGCPGLENLAYIPGTVGAAPVQNIGAYGVEAAERIHSVEVFDLKSGEKKDFSNEECDFAYRSSVFKKPENKHLLITSVTFRLPKVWKPCTGYRALADEIEANRFPTLSPEDVYACVIALRKRKLPNPSEIGSAGSFFKNPVVSKEEFFEISKLYPSVVSYPLAGGRYKLSAAWLIENAGLKGIRMGDAGVWERQPLVLVNYGLASGDEVYAMAQDVRRQVKNCFKVTLEPEVVLV